MSGDDLLKGLFGLLITTVVAVVGWLVRTVLTTERSLMLTNEAAKTLRAEVDHLKSSQITTECVREVIDEALTKRDQLGLERRAEWERRFTLEVRQAIHDEVSKLIREELERVWQEIRRSRVRHTPMPSPSDEDTNQ
jgi:hypothetical protein